jgi:hypothetical protein
MEDDLNFLMEEDIIIKKWKTTSIFEKMKDLNCLKMVMVIFSNGKQTQNYSQMEDNLNIFFN